MAVRFRKRKLKNYIFIGICVVMIVWGLGCSAEVWISREPFYSDNTQLEVINQELKSNMVLTQEFKVIGDGLNRVNTFFDNGHEGAGIVTMQLLNKDGLDLVLPYTFDLSVYGENDIIFPTYIENALEKREKYFLKWSCTEIDEADPPTVRVYRALDLQKKLKIDGEKANVKLYVEYNYDSYYHTSNIVCAIIFCGIIFLIAVFQIELNATGWFWIKECLFIALACFSWTMIDMINIGEGTVTFFRLVSNIIPIYILIRVLYLITNSLPCAGGLTGGISFVFGTVNYYVNLFRGRPILPWDLSSLNTAVTVMSSYNFELTYEIITAFLILVFMIQLSLFFRSKQKQPKNAKIVYANGVVLASLLLIYTTAIYPKLYGDLWSMADAYRDEGIIAGFIAHCQFARYNKPEGYSQKQCLSLMENIDLITADQAGESARNIIVIMNESFADLRVIGDGQLDGDYMPFIDSLEENVIKGNLYVPIYGAGTSNTEFEALVGASCAYISAVPYQTLFNHEVDSILTSLKAKEFYAEALHPYHAANWNRDSVYSYMGFDEFVTLADMNIKNGDMMRWCVSDYRDYEEIVNAYENNENDNFFLFNVTMQNHGGYEESYDNFLNTADLSEYGEFKEAETYLSLVKESDSSLEELISYFSDVKEPTLICFFGDHQPSIEEEFYEFLYGKELSALSREEAQQRYITPLVLWTNYDIEEQYIDKISSNYIGTLILKAANLPMEPFESFLWELYQEYPVISTTGIWDKEGVYYSSPYEAESKMLMDYQWLQYYRIKENAK